MQAVEKHGFILLAYAGVAAMLYRLGDCDAKGVERISIGCPDLA